MAELSDKFNKLKDDIMEYTSMKIRLFKFEVVERIAIERSSLLSGVLLWLVVFFLLLFGFITIALYLNEVLDSSYAGFGLVTIFWALIMIVVLIFRRPIKKYILLHYLDRNIPKP